MSCVRNKLWLCGTLLLYAAVLRTDADADSSDNRWEGGIDRGGFVDCHLGRAGGRCMSTANCIRNLTAVQDRYCMHEEMERSFLGEHLYQYSKGIYTCSCCNATLFESRDKFDANKGHISFTKPAQHAIVGYKHHEGSWSQHPRDTGIHCEHCGAHIGNVREDGPPPLGRRYYANSVCLQFHCSLPKCAPDMKEHNQAKKLARTWRAFDRGDDFEVRFRRTVILFGIIGVLTGFVLAVVWCCQRRRKRVVYQRVAGEEGEVDERDLDG